MTGGTCGIRQETSTRRYSENTVHGPVKQKRQKKKQTTTKKKQAAWEDDKKSEPRQAKRMKIQRHKQTETWRWRKE